VVLEFALAEGDGVGSVSTVIAEFSPLLAFPLTFDGDGEGEAVGDGDGFTDGEGDGEGTTCAIVPAAATSTGALIFTVLGGRQVVSLQT
jgi:hypothetical protein